MRVAHRRRSGPVPSAGTVRATGMGCDPSEGRAMDRDPTPRRSAALSVRRTRMQPATIGTAGPAGHGKSALVRALAGEPAPDAAAASESTVDLGFGFHDIAGRRFGVVDLPGTSRLVRGHHEQ